MHRGGRFGIGFGITRFAEPMLEGLGFGIVELAAIEPHRPGGRPFLRRRCAARSELPRHASSPMRFASCSAARSTCFSTALKIGKASCRERVCQYVSIQVVALSLKQKLDIKYNS